jgi:hypothetical protein
MDTNATAVLCCAVLAVLCCAVLCAAACRYVSLLRLLRLGRAYRLYSWVQLMAYRQTISLLVLTLTRNFAVRLPAAAAALVDRYKCTGWRNCCSGSRDCRLSLLLFIDKCKAACTSCHMCTSKGLL